MDKNYSAKKYFIFAFKTYLTNDNKILAKKCMPSIRELLYDYIEIYEEINKNREQEKLQRARDELLIAIGFFIKNSIYFEEGIYKDELIRLIDQIKNINKIKGKEKDLQYTRIYNSFSSFIKKINNDNIYSILIELVKKFENYCKIDKAIDSLISELIYENYSMRYLDDWYNENVGRKNITAETINDILDEFKHFKRKPQHFIYYLSLLNKNDKEKIKLNHNMELKKENYDELSLIDSVSEDDALKFLQNSKGYNLYSIQYESMDLYKGLENIINSIKFYFQMINYIENDNKEIYQNKVVVKVGEKYNKLRLDSNDEKTLFSSIEHRERSDIEDFIKYRDRVYINNIYKSKEINNLQRALNIVKGQKNQLKETRLINLWAVLEYLLTFYEGASIISKAKDIIPKLVSLYNIKDEINIFWSRLYKYKNSDYDIINQILDGCIKVDDEYYYDLEKLIQFIQNKGKAIINEFEFNDILKRSIAQIGMLINETGPRGLSSFLCKSHNSYILEKII